MTTSSILKVIKQLPPYFSENYTNTDYNFKNSQYNPTPVNTRINKQRGLMRVKNKNMLKIEKIKIKPLENHPLHYLLEKEKMIE